MMKSMNITRLGGGNHFQIPIIIQVRRHRTRQRVGTYINGPASQFCIGYRVPYMYMIIITGKKQFQAAIAIQVRHCNAAANIITRIKFCHDRGIMVQHIEIAIIISSNDLQVPIPIQVHQGRW